MNSPEDIRAACEALAEWLIERIEREPTLEHDACIRVTDDPELETWRVSLRSGRRDAADYSAIGMGYDNSPGAAVRTASWQWRKSRKERA